MKKLLPLAVVAFLFGCDEIPSASRGTATNCTLINTPVGCPDVYRITDPDTGAVLYVAKSSSGSCSMTLLPKSEVQAEKKPESK